MRKIGLCTLGLISALAPLRADWKITTAYTFNGHRSVRTEYFKSGLWRSEVELTRPAGNRMVVVLDHDGHRQIRWNVDAREYIIETLHPSPQSVSEPMQPAAPAPVLDIDVSTTDTGDRQTMFGRTARHLITHEKRYTTEPGSTPVLESESETDGWYVDAPGLPGATGGTATFLVASIGRQPIVKVNHTGPAPTGLPVLMSTATQNFHRGERISVDHRAVQVTELFEGTLSPELFEPPSGFQRVSQMENGPISASTDYLQMFWQGLQDFLAGLFF